MSEPVAPLWELRDITKSYPGVRANDGISIRLFPGEIHALLGENGCGKSTLIRILSGVNQPDSGEILCRGEAVRLANPLDAWAKDIGTVFQEFSLVPTLSVAENIFLGRYQQRGPFLNWRGMREQTRHVLSLLGITTIAPERIVSTLSVAEQQLVEIAKAIQLDAKLLILDEPTTALGQAEIQRLQDLLRMMKHRGVSVLYISHRLDEVLELVDSATILRNGKVVLTAARAKLDIGKIVSAMIGSDVKEHYPKQRNATSVPLLEVRGLAAANGTHDVSFEVRRGEVFGLGGVIGSGRTEIARALFGADRVTRGEIRLDGKLLRLAGPRGAIRAGFAFVPENRKFDALFFNFNGSPNITSASLGRLSRGLLLDRRREREIGLGFIRDLEISPAAADKTVNLLSGGNQQKIVLARWLFARSKVLILDEPTQGIDIGARIAVYRLINEMTAQGCAVILISSDHNELIAISDRIGIVRDHTLVEVMDARAVTHNHLVQASAREDAIDDSSAGRTVVLEHRPGGAPANARSGS